MDIEAMAQAMFDEFHARFNRQRSWLNHPDGDGMESGRDTFRRMAEAAVAVAGMVEAVAPFIPPDEPVITEAVGDAKKSKK